jgi:hypothetical protein
MSDPIIPKTKLDIMNNINTNEKLSVNNKYPKGIISENSLVVEPSDELPQPVPEINYDNALQMLIEELDRLGIYSTNAIVKTSIHVLDGKIYALQNKIEYASMILSKQI